MNTLINWVQRTKKMHDLTPSYFLILASGFGLFVLIVMYVQTDKKDKERRDTLKTLALILLVIYVISGFFAT